MINKNTIDPNALQYYRMLKEAGFSAYFVGGSVRDLLLGKNPKDFDIATNATPHQIKRVIPYGRIIGRRFRHVMLERDGGRYEIVTFRGLILPNQDSLEGAGGENEESSPENEIQVEEEGRKNYPDLNQFGNAQQDAIRRDFTINALFYDPDADELVDYVEGKLDIDRKVIRTIGEAAARMEEDPIRILRAMRHKTKLELSYDPALEAAMKEKAPLLEETSKDRIREEFLKVSLDRSIGNFLSEARSLGILQHVAPWLAQLNDEQWESALGLWKKFAESTPMEGMRPLPDMGLSFMMVPLIDSLVLEPYKLTVQPGDRNYLPDMKYFLSCEILRDYLLRNLRISRAQTDYVVRTLFYWSRMTGLWIENGPPRRVIGRLFQHPPALLAARMVQIVFTAEGKAVADWIQELANFNPDARGKNRNDHRRDRNDHRPDDQEDSSGDDASFQEGASNENQSPTREPREQRAPREREYRRNDNYEQESTPKYAPLPPPDQPMIWNGPLHAPVLRPTFSQEPVIRWARKNQTVRAFRPSGIPNQPTDYAMLKSHLVGNYRPEITETRSNDDDQSGSGDNRRNDRGPRGRNDRGPRGRNDRGPRGRNDRGPRGRNDRGPRGRNNNQQNYSQEQAPQGAPTDAPINADEDSYGNTLRPGETPAFAAPVAGDPYVAPVSDVAYDDDEDNIGNRLDAPPTSGHVGVNGEGVLGANNPNRPNNNRAPHRGGGGRGGPRNHRGGGRNNRGGGGRGGPSGGGRFPPRNNQSNNS